MLKKHDGMWLGGALGTTGQPNIRSTWYQAHDPRGRNRAERDP